MAKWLIGGSVAGLVFSPLLVLMVAVGTLGAARAATAQAAGLTPVVFDAYEQAAQRCDGLDWFVLAGIGQVETVHGTYGGASVDDDGWVRPPIIGIALDGSNSTAVIADTDDGRLDGDIVWDRAVGPMQFIPSSWAIFAVDGDGDGLASPHNMFDAAAAAADHLCGTDGTLGDTGSASNDPGPASNNIDSASGDLRAALFSYNRSDAYVDLVLEWAGRYELLGTTGVGFIVCPVPGSSFIDSWHAPRGGGTRQHQGVDMFAPHGAPILAPESGSIEFYWNDIGGQSFRLYGDSDTFYYGTHLSGYEGESRGVIAGEVIGYVGTTGNAAGTPPHLHFQIHPDGRGTPAINPTPAVDSACSEASFLLKARS